MASVSAFRNPSGATVWRVQFRLNKKPTQRTFLTMKDADRFKALVDRNGPDAAVEALERHSDSDITFEDWTIKYLDPNSGLLTGIQPGTRDGYARIARTSFFPMLGGFPIDTITKADIGRWVAWQEKQYAHRWYDKDGNLKPGAQPIAAKTVRNYHALLSNIFKAAVENRLRPDNPAHRTRLSEGRPREAVFLSPTEFNQLLQAVPDYYKPLVAFLCASQARWSEATALTWGDFNLASEPPTVRITKAWKKNPGGSPIIDVPKSRKARRTISLWPEIVAYLGEPGPADELVFLGRGKGAEERHQIWYGPFSTRIWKKAVENINDPDYCKSVGAKVLGKHPRIHDLRHTGASWLIADGKPLPFIQNRLGHESITTTVGVYGHLLPDAHTQMAASLAGIMSGSLKEISGTTDSPYGAEESSLTS